MSLAVQSTVTMEGWIIGVAACVRLCYGQHVHIPRVRMMNYGAVLSPTKFSFVSRKVPDHFRSLWRAHGPRRCCSLQGMDTLFTRRENLLDILWHEQPRWPERMYEFFPFFETHACLLQTMCFVVVNTRLGLIVEQTAPLKSLGNNIDGYTRTLSSAWARCASSSGQVPLCVCLEVPLA